jgi:hemerythrin
LPVVDPAALPQVPLAFMNEDHAEEARLVNALADALAALKAGKGTKEDVLGRYQSLERHTREHFERENEAMRKAAFHAYSMHAGEHERVLAEMAGEAGAFASSGDADRLYTYVSQAVPAWLVQHIRTMDQVTARFVSTAPAR